MPDVSGGAANGFECARDVHDIDPPDGGCQGVLDDADGSRVAMAVAEPGGASTVDVDPTGRVASDPRVSSCRRRGSDL